jgi:methylmalonyl-CoA/ethylmalonyl-CoA epimerase
VSRLRQVAQHVDDRARATAFYRDVLRLPLVQEFDPPGLSFFDLGGGTRLLLEAGATAALLYLDVDDIEAERARLEAAGVSFVDDIHQIHVHDGTMAPAGVEEWMTFFHDCEGNLLGLCEQRTAS